MSLLDEVGATLEAAGIRHALIGALALATYGVNRLADEIFSGAASSCIVPAHPAQPSRVYRLICGMALT